VFLAPWAAKARAHFNDQYLVVYWLFNWRRSVDGRGCLLSINRACMYWTASRQTQSTWRPPLADKFFFTGIGKRKINVRSPRQN
jgi:hypothetical protein